MSNRLYSSLLMLIALTFSLTVNAQIRPQQHDQLRAALDRNDLSAAEQTLREMSRFAPDAFASNNYDYLLARLFENRGANPEANALFQRVIARNSPLAGYAVWRLGEIARAAGNPGEEQRLLSRLISQLPDHLFRERAIQRLADSQFRGGQYQNVIATVRLLAGPRRDAMVTIGEAHLAMWQTDAARASFESVLAGGAQDDASLRASLGLDRMDDASVAMLTEAERLRRARIYQFNRYFADARRHWMALVRYFPQSPKRAEALFQLGRGYFLENNFAEAAKWYQRAYDEFPNTDEGEQGFYYVGHCYQFLDDTNRAIARYEAYLQQFPEGEFIGYAHLNAIDTLRSAGRLEEALQWAARAQTIPREPFIAVSALFQQAKIRLTQNDFQTALGDFTQLKSRNLNLRGLTATTNLPEVTFMRGYCLEKLGRNEEAAAEYLSLPEARSGAAGYYGWRAGERLRAMAANARTRNLIANWLNKYVAGARAAGAQGNAAMAKTAAHQALRLTGDRATRDELWEILRTAYARLPGYQIPGVSVASAGRTFVLDAGAPTAAGTAHQTIANELLFLGLYDEGAPELLAASSLTATTAYYCSRGPCAHRTLDYSEPALKRLPEDFRLELLPRTLAEMFYPMPYRDSLNRHAASRGIDPRFVLSIVRQESSYDPKVKSGQAARGMMQFIPSTANQIATQLALGDFNQNDLYTPDIAILFGSQYIKNLNDEFGAGQAVAAAYNGSEESVRRWRARARSNEVDRLVIEVAKRESKDYVFKVMNNFNAYRNLHP
ncbi:MAG: transglycosylase SLT domain-containing protein [Blastocatellia bacterium]